MLSRNSSRFALLIHASAGLACFMYLLSPRFEGAADVGKAADGRLLLSDEQKAEIVKEQLDSASRISVIFSCGFFFLDFCRRGWYQGLKFLCLPGGVEVGVTLVVVVIIDGSSPL